MTNFEYLKSMSFEELAEWFDKNGCFDDSPWLNSFVEKYCNRCASIELNCEDAQEKLDIELWLSCGTECDFCELEPKKCRFFPELDSIPDNKEIVKMWLQEVAE